MAAESWLVVLQPDGTVDAVEGGAPTTWMGRKLEDAPGAPEDVRGAAVELLRSRSSSYLRRRFVRTTRATIEIVLVEAVPLRKVHTHAGELLVRVLDVFASQAKSSAIELIVGQDENVPAVFSLDREKITWAITTLVGNALRYADQSPTKTPHVDVHLSWDEARRELVIEVADNGPGMTEQQAKWLFDRDPSTGTSAGLALLMVRDVVAAHRGTVTVETRLGRGTRFVLRLPRVPT